jgi:hypothetical protein
MKIGSSTRSAAKNRYEAVLPSKIEDPTLADIYSKIRSNKEVK